MNRYWVTDPLNLSDTWADIGQLVGTRRRRLRHMLALTKLQGSIWGAQEGKESQYCSSSLTSACHTPFDIVLISNKLLSLSFLFISI